MKKKVMGILFSLCLGIVLTACRNGGSDENSVIKMGINGEVNSIWKSVQSRLADEGITLEFVSFSDYNVPNQALNDGEIDLNCFQTQSFFDQFVEDHGLDLVPLETVYFAPMAIFSTKIDDLSELKDGDKISIPNDASNGGRALLLLEEAGVIKLKDGVGKHPTVKDIVENPKNIEFVELVAQQIPRSFDDVTVAVVNNNVAIQSGLSVVNDSIFIESQETEGIETFFNIIAVKAEDKDNPLYQKFLEVYKTEETKQAMYDEFKGGWIPLF